MAPVSLGIDFEWEEQPGDGTPCKNCNDPVFYKAHVLVVVSGPERSVTNYKICDSCYNALEKDGETF